MFKNIIACVFLVAIASVSFSAYSYETGPDATCFQSGAPYSPELDFSSDLAIIYGCGQGFEDRAKLWRDRGYNVSMMTGIAWGAYDSYYASPDGSIKKDEIQTIKSGKLLMHGDSATVGYNVPTDAYIEYVKKYVEPAVQAGVQGIYLEEPEFWAESGWSEAFKKEWLRYYNEPWSDPDSSVDAQYRASRLKYEMYYKALKEVFSFAKKRAAELGRTIECHVPTHSLINYSQWRIVSPESHLMDISECDGYIAQVWTGTARAHNMYRGEYKERTFENAYLEYGQMLGMVRPTGRKVWFLADPVEDNPNRSWSDYKRNYECTVIASLMWPEVSRYEVMPWPDRIFNGKYPKADLDAKAADKEGIPPDYATQLLAVINSLNDMKQDDVEFTTGTRGIGVLVSDTLMFQRAAPQQSDAHLSNFYGLAMPFVKAGVPVEIVQLENVLQPKCLEPYRVLFLTYEGQKPLKPEYHEALARWVRSGGRLIFVDDNADPYNNVREWWNDNGKNSSRPFEHLFSTLGIMDEAKRAPQKIGEGYARVLEERPSAIAERKDGAETVLGLAAEMFKLNGQELKTQNYLMLRRGPYVAASVLEDSVSEETLILRGHFIDIFNSTLPVVVERSLAPGERTLLYDLDWARAHGVKEKVAAAAARVKKESASANGYDITLRGPKGTHANARILLPAAPAKIETKQQIQVDSQWDADSSTLFLSLENTGDDVTVSLSR
jgi:hypothetical protein